jgi:hypothetical protein
VGILKAHGPPDVSVLFSFYLQVSLKGLGYLMRELGNSVLIGTSHQQQQI